MAIADGPVPGAIIVWVRSVLLIVLDELSRCTVDRTDSECCCGKSHERQAGSGVHRSELDGVLDGSVLLDFSHI